MMTFLTIWKECSRIYRRDCLGTTSPHPSLQRRGIEGPHDEGHDSRGRLWHAPAAADRETAQATAACRGTPSVGVESPAAQETWDHRRAPQSTSSGVSHCRGVRRWLPVRDALGLFARTGDS